MSYYYTPRQSRLSSRTRARESIFPGGSELHREGSQPSFSPDLLESVRAMEDCCEEAHEAQQLLRNGTRDLPRMAHVLDNQRVFLLVDEGTVKKYKADLSDEIEPQITELISRAEKGLEALQKKRLLLQTKVKTAQSKPQQPSVSDGVNRRLQLLVKQRQRLEAQVRELEGEILEMEADQKRR
ncbi:Spc19-domain-containing protein [Lactarius quietus]|nr:Spc19-domain-containing protein [Lactarius quietus]